MFQDAAKQFKHSSFEVRASESVLYWPFLELPDQETRSIYPGKSVHSNIALAFKHSIDTGLKAVSQSMNSRNPVTLVIKSRDFNGVNSIGEVVEKLLAQKSLEIHTSTTLIIGLDLKEGSTLTINILMWIQKKGFCFRYAFMKYFDDVTITCTKNIQHLNACVTHELLCLIYA